jgi:precorrin-2 dehydrogenase/sirohydrochlorin ferrochelatase
MEAFPAFFPLAGKRLAVAGDGEPAEAKLRLLAGCPAEVARLSGEAAERPESYVGAMLAFVASYDEAFRRKAAAAAKAAGVPVNVTDAPELSDFHTPAVIDRGQVVAAIGSAGAAPILTALLRAELEAKIPQGLGRLAALLGKLRPQIRAAFPDLAQRRAFLRAVLDGPVAAAADAGDLAQAERLLKSELGKGVAAAGRVWLIEVPAERDLLSLRAARALAIADVLALGDAVPPDVATLARRDASWRQLADLDAAALAQEAVEGRQVAVVAEAVEIAARARELSTLAAPVEILAAAPER